MTETHYYLNDKLVLKTDEANPHLGGSFRVRKQRYKITEVEKEKDGIIIVKIVEVEPFLDD